MFHDFSNRLAGKRWLARGRGALDLQLEGVTTRGTVVPCFAEAGVKERALYGTNRQKALRALTLSSLGAQ
jgi:hypothetical protein